MSMTSSDICEIRDTIKKMIERIKFSITIVPLKGKTINPGEQFLVKVQANNPICLQFKNVHWELKVVSPDPSFPIACLIPPDPPAIAFSSFGGNTLPAGCYEKIVISYPEISPKSRIPAEGSTEIEVKGMANEEIDDTVEGVIKARVFVDVDREYLYAFGFPSSTGEQDLEIVR